MSGVDYGGTMVTGLLFTQEAGWDKAGWYDFPWDIYGDSGVVAFRGDGSTVSFTFASAPDSTKVVEAEIIPEKQQQSSGLPNHESCEGGENGQGAGGPG